jgi:hypothetical protein
MRNFWFLMILSLAVAGTYAIRSSDGYGKIEVKVAILDQTPRQFMLPGDPNLLLLPAEKQDRKYSFIYTSNSWFEKNQEYLRLHPDDAVIMTSSGGSEPTTSTVVFSNRPLPDPKFFRQ